MKKMVIIFRNFTTGKELISTTDTVNGTRILRFGGNDNTVTTAGIPVLIRRFCSLDDHRFSLTPGLRVGFVLDRSGKTVIGDYEVVSIN